LKLLQVKLALRQVIEAVKLNRQDFKTIEKEAMQQLAKKGWLVDYISIRSSVTLQPVLDANQGDFIVLGAATLNQTRLIDNIEFCAKPLN